MSRVTMDFRARYGPWAVVAGASEGLGAEYAAQLAAKGLNLVLIARRKELLDNLSTRLARDYTVEVHTLEIDLASEDIDAQVEAVTRDIEVGLLIYNAATVVIGSFFEISLQTHLNEIAVNCRAPVTLTYLLGQHMLKRKHGGIVLMSSLSASQGSPLIANYTATKAYNKLLAEGLWDELRAQGIDVLACAPAVVSTPRAQESSPDAGISSSTTMSPRTVATETLAALGKQPVIIPGRSNRLANLVMQRILPHKLAIQIMGRVMRSTYQKS